MITVVTSAYKASWCLGDMVKSVTQQTCKPDRLLIGVDGCTQTLIAAKHIKMIYQDAINMDIVWFPRNAGVYRVKNTLSLLADPGTIVFFDADDIMYSDHVETMAAAVGPDRFAFPTAECVDLRTGQRQQWSTAYGACALDRSAFFCQGGFEPWRCGADSEAVQRWQEGGLQKMETDHPTMLVRKHDEGLTQAEETRYHSPIRRQYSAEIKRRKGTAYRLDAIAIADWRYAPAAPLHPVGVEYVYCEGARAMHAAAVGEAKEVIGDLLETRQRALNNRQRKAQERAEAWLAATEK